MDSQIKLFNMLPKTFPSLSMFILICACCFNTTTSQVQPEYDFIVVGGRSLSRIHLGKVLMMVQVELLVLHWPQGLHKMARNLYSFWKLAKAQLR